MNHHYPDNYHGGYVRGAAGMQGMGYGHGVYDDPSAMARMGHPRNNYQVPPYRDSGQMQPMMQQHQQQMGGMYSHGGYMGQMGGNHYSMGNYPGYGMQGMNHAGIAPPGQGMGMGPQGHSNMMGAYYNHPVNPHNSNQQQQQQQQQQQHATMANQTPSSNYSQSPNTSNPSMSHGQGGQMMSSMVNNQTPNHPPAMPRGQGSVTTASSSHSVPPTQVNSSSNFQSPVSSPQNSMMMQGSHAQPRPVAEAMSTAGNSHQVPQHPMRHQSSQQTPQEVADSILQIASSYPTNQTVQVPLKGRHAPYHIPRSPHYNMSSTETSHSSPGVNVNHFQQQSPASQPSPTPSTSSVKSPTPALAPIPNPIPSPGISGIKSPSSHCLSPSGPQRSPGGHMASSYSGHCQTVASPQHYSPGGRGTPQQHMSAYAQSPPPPHLSSRNASLYPSPNDQTAYSMSDNQSLHANFSMSQTPSAHQPGNSMTSGPPPAMSNVPYNQQCGNNNPLMSLQKLVMRPETQVVDPKSVVNDACLASQSNENSANSKNCEDPAERFVESSNLSVGCSGQSSSLGSQSDDLQDKNQGSLDPSFLSNNEMTPAPAHGHHDSIGKVDNADQMNGLPTSSFRSEPDGGVENNSEKCDALSGVSPSIPNEITEIKEEKLYSLPVSTSPESKSVPDSIETDSGSIGNNDGNKSQKVSPEVTNLLKGENLEEICENQLECKTEDVEQSKEMKAGYSVLSEKPNIQLHETEVNTSEHGSSLLNEDDNKDDSLEECAYSIFTNLKTGESQKEVKQVLNETKSPGVLSEVQVVVNGNDVLREEEEKKECKRTSRSKMMNGLKTLRSKISMTKKSSPFVRLTTPCSIAVGADEREVCEQFAFRRNGYCHTLRASRLLYSGRSRQDSTGHGDSDESVENMSDSSFHVLGNPQDGCKKKTMAKKNDAKQSTSSSQAKGDNKNDVKKESSNVRGASNVQVSQSHVCEDKDLSDEDGEMCYYEGVDSSDFVINANSSEDSFSSSQEGKPIEQQTLATAQNEMDVLDNTSKELASKTGDDEEVKKEVIGDEGKDTDTASSPPAKRTRRGPVDKQEEKTKRKSSLNHPVTSDVLTNGTDSSIHNASPKEALKNVRSPSSRDENSAQQENGKIAKTRVSKRNPVLGKLPPNGQTKLPEVVVKLEKTDCLKNSSDAEKMDTIDLTRSPKEEENTLGSIDGMNKLNENSMVGENTVDCKDVDIIEDVKVEGDVVTTASPSKSGKSKKKQPMKRKQKKANPSPVSKGKDEEAKDSFKLMKFSKTLDLMKSQRKKEHNVTGPCLRVIGSRTSPKRVSVCNQSAQSIGAGSSKHGQKPSNKQTVSNPSTIHVMANLPSDKTVLVSSAKAIHQQSWACAFCHHQSSFHSLGDLFGPYHKEEDLPTVERLISEEAKKLKDNPPDTKGSSKKRKSLAAKKETGPLEVWIHEACALWAPGVYVLGNKLYGMGEVMKDVSDSICSGCKEKGAMIGCLHKGCVLKYHISCAMDEECCLDEENFSLLCPKHKDKKIRVVSASSLPVS